MGNIENQQRKSREKCTFFNADPINLFKINVFLLRYYLQNKVNTRFIQ